MKYIGIEVLFTYFNKASDHSIPQYTLAHKIFNDIVASHCSEIGWNNEEFVSQAMKQTPRYKKMAQGIIDDFYVEVIRRIREENKSTKKK